jgi:hypothetical protein
MVRVVLNLPETFVQVKPVAPNAGDTERRGLGRSEERRHRQPRPQENTPHPRASNPLALEIQTVGIEA